MTWDSYADDWDNDEGARAYSQAAFESLTRTCAERSVPLVGARACDFGCGTGLLTEKLAAVCAVVIALDTSIGMVGRLQQKIDRLGLTNVHTIAETVEDAVRHAAPLLGSPCDVVVCSSVCAFLDDYPQTIVTLVQLLRPGGLFVQWDWERDPRADDSFGLTRGQVEAALTGAGLEAVQVAPAFDVSIGDTTVRPLMGSGQAPNGKPGSLP